MPMLRSKLLLASAVALMSSTAFAADLAPAPYEPAAPVYLPFSWTGFYVGAQAGYLWGESKGGAYFRANGAVDVDGSVDPDGFTGGVHAGYNYQFDQFVVGVEGDVNFSGADSGRVALSAPGNFASSKLTWEGSARLRVGYAFDRFLPYVTGGVAFGEYEFKPFYAGVGQVLNNSTTHVGWTVGAGLEYAFTDNITGRIEYRYTDFGEEKYAIPGFPAEESKVDLQTHAVRVGISYKF